MDMVDSSTVEVCAAAAWSVEERRIWRKVVRNFVLSETYAMKLTEEIKQEVVTTTRKNSSNVLW